MSEAHLAVSEAHLADLRAEIAHLQDRLRDANEALNRAAAIAYELRCQLADTETQRDAARACVVAISKASGVRGVRAELSATDTGVVLMLCDPVGDEQTMAEGLVALMDAALQAHFGDALTGHVRVKAPR